MRENFGKWLEIYDEEATKDDVQKAKDEFDAEVAKISTRKFMIVSENALPYAELLRDWNKKYAYWEKGQWKGIIKFDKVITEMVENFKNNPTDPFEVDYQTLLFLYQKMSNPVGMGLDSAIAMAEFENFDLDNVEVKDNDNFVTYTHIFQSIYNHVQDLANNDKKLVLLREKINIASAGIKFDWKISEIEEFIELHDKWISLGVPDGEELQKMS